MNYMFILYKYLKLKTLAQYLQHSISKIKHCINSLCFVCVDNHIRILFIKIEFQLENENNLIHFAIYVCTLIICWQTISIENVILHNQCKLFKFTTSLVYDLFYQCYRCISFFTYRWCLNFSSWNISCTQS